MDKQIVIYVYSVILFSDLKKKKKNKPWMSLKNIILSERNQTQDYIWNSSWDSWSVLMEIWTAVDSGNRKKKFSPFQRTFWTDGYSPYLDWDVGYTEV